MATYKVLQDIEAEDKLVGPLTLRQFIYAGITAVCLYICFILLTKKLLYAIPIFLLPGLLTGFFAFPWGRDQPTEIWALAKIRFLLKPRQRIWNQSGVKELVTITAPKRVEVNYTNGLSQFEVKSRLRALADTIDTRGWAVRNVTGGVYTRQLPAAAGPDSDRLIDVGSMPLEKPLIDASNAHDMLDAQTNPVAQNFDRMMEQSGQTHRAQIVQDISQAQHEPAARQIPAGSSQLPAPQANGPTTPSNDNWFMSQPVAAPAQATTAVTTTQTPTVPVEERELAEHLRQQNSSQGVSYAHMHTILPLSEQQAGDQQAAQAAAAAKAKQAPMTRPPDPAIMALARNNDLNVATIAREAKRDSEPPDEVVISLH